MSVMKKLIVRNNSISAGFDQRFEYLISDYETNSKKGTYRYHENSNLYVAWEYYSLEQHLFDEFKKFEEIQSTLFFGADQSAPYFKKWIEATIPLNISRGSSSDRWLNTLSFWDASSEFWRNGRDVLYKKDLYSFYNNGSCDSDFSWRFVFDNFPYIYAYNYDLGTSDYTDENTRSIRILLEISWTILGIASGVIFLVGILIIRPTVSRIFREVEIVSDETYRTSSSHFSGDGGAYGCSKSICRVLLW